MEKKLSKQLWFFIVLLGVVWILLLLIQIQLTRKVYSHQKDLFAVKLNKDFDDAFAPLDTVDYNTIDSLVALSMREHSVSYPYDLGVYSLDDGEFLFLSEGADVEALIESGFQYKLLRVSHDEAHLDTILIHFPSLVHQSGGTRQAN